MYIAEVHFQFIPLLCKTTSYEYVKIPNTGIIISSHILFRNNDICRRLTSASTDRLSIVQVTGRCGRV
jgi:hypothetical protein